MYLVRHMRGTASELGLSSEGDKPSSPGEAVCLYMLILTYLINCCNQRKQIGSFFTSRTKLNMMKSTNCAVDSSI